MNRLGNRFWPVVSLGLLAVPVCAVGIAYGCTALATVSTSSPSAVAGSSVTVAGKFFAPHDPADIRTSPALVRMDTVDGPALATASPNSAGTFSVAITVPSTTAAGDHVLIVTQNGINGAPAFGTPARTVLTVDPAPLPAPVVTVPEPSALAPVTVPAALSAPIVTTAKKKLTKAQKIARCKSKYKPSSAKTKKGRKRIAARRSACIRSVS
jgi:hypothetical protein